MLEERQWTLIEMLSAAVGEVELCKYFTNTWVTLFSDAWFTPDRLHPTGNYTAISTVQYCTLPTTTAAVVTVHRLCLLNVAKFVYVHTSCVWSIVLSFNEARLVHNFNRNRLKMKNSTNMNRKFKRLYTTG